MQSDSAVIVPSSKSIFVTIETTETLIESNKSISIYPGSQQQF